MEGFRIYLVFLCLPLVVACGGGGGGSDSGSGGTSGGGGATDTTAPSGYLVSALTDPVTSSNQANVGFDLSGAEVGATYRFSFTDTQSAQVADTGTISSVNQSFSGIDLTGLADGVIELALTLTDAANNVGAVVQQSITKSASSSNDNIEVSGQVTFDRVPYNQNGQGLDYSSIQSMPARGLTIRVVDSAGSTIASTKSDSIGNYSVSLPANTNARVEVLSEMAEANPLLNWQTQVVDNSDGNSLYVLQGSLINTGTQNQIRNLHADSGWTGAGYGNERAAAPFAILDSIYQIYDKLDIAEVSVSMPELQIRWSPANSNGSFYQGYIEIAGNENVDTDEFDQHVIVHEWRHYFESAVSRGDTIGGSHSISNPLEPRTAYSEGVGNAWSAIILDDPVYKDSLGNRQSSGFQFNIEGSAITSEGWYIEKSVQEIVYDLVDSNDDGADTLEMPLKTLIDAWQSPDYLNQNSLTTIYSLQAALDDVSPATAGQVDALYAAEDIQGTDVYGAGETNSGGLTYSLPVYHQLTVGAAPFEICSDNSEGEYNRLQNRQLVRFSIAASGSYTLIMERNAGSTNWNAGVSSDPDFVLYQQGEILTVFPDGRSGNNNVETWTGQLEPGDYVLDAYEFLNTDDQSGTGGLFCFDLSVT